MWFRCGGTAKTRMSRRSAIPVAAGRLDGGRHGAGARTAKPRTSVVNERVLILRDTGRTWYAAACGCGGAQRGERVRVDEVKRVSAHEAHGVRDPRQ